MTERSRQTLPQAQQRLDQARRTLPRSTPTLRDAAQTYGKTLERTILQTVQSSADHRREQWEQNGQLPWWMNLKNRFWQKVSRRA